jgi:hypothetical protein
MIFRVSGDLGRYVPIRLLRVLEFPSLRLFRVMTQHKRALHQRPQAELGLIFIISHASVADLDGCVQISNAAQFCNCLLTSRPSRSAQLPAKDLCTTLAALSVYDMIEHPYPAMAHCSSVPIHGQLSSGRSGEYLQQGLVVKHMDAP